RRVMLEHLQISCSQRKQRHRLWRDIHAELENESRFAIEQAYQQARGRQRLELEQRVQHAVRGMQNSIQAKPWMLSALRGARGLLDVGAVVLALYCAYRTDWFAALLLVPLGIGLT